MGNKDGYLETVGAKIRRAREHLGVSQYELGLAVGLDDSSISRIERGMRDGLGLSTLRAIARELDINISELVE